MKGYRKILIAINGSDKILKQGIDLARSEKTWITVLKVIPPYEGDLNLTGIKNIGDAIDSGAEKVLSEAKDWASRERALVKTRLEEGKIHEKILEVAEEERCDLIIMGDSRRRGMKWLFGSDVLQKVIGHAPCPVLVVNS